VSEHLSRTPSRWSPRQRGAALVGLYLAGLAALLIAGTWAAPATAAGGYAPNPSSGAVSVAR
jgi:hypothetical protein